MIEIRNLDKIYHMGNNEIRALRKINLDIRKGDFISIMGRSGSGKTTLLNILGCLDLPSSGAYKIDNILTSTLNDGELSRLRNRLIGFVFQDFNLLPQLSVLENVKLPLRYNETVDRKQRRDRCIRLLDMVGLGDRIDHRPTQLSGGQMQRVAIARALINDPLLILADEPSGSLDSTTSEEIMSIFRDLNRKGRTIVMATHDHHLASYSHSIINLSDGSIEASISGTNYGHFRAH